MKGGEGFRPLRRNVLWSTPEAKATIGPQPLSPVKCVTMRDVNEGLIANMIADGEDLRRIYESLAVLNKKVDLIFEMMKVEQEQRLASMNAQTPSSPD